MKCVLLFVWLLLFCAGCRDKDTSNSSQKESLIAKIDSTSVTAGNNELGIDPWETRDMVVNIPLLKTYLLKAQQMRESLLAELKKSTPDQADNLYLSAGYKFSDTPEFQKVDSLTMPTIMRSSGAFNDYPQTDQDSEVLNLLAQQGLEPIYIGEGYSELRTNPLYYYNIFESYVSNETKEFMKIWADHDDLITADAGLIVPLDLLYKRCLEWEKYLDKYPQSKYKEAVVSQYGMYIGYILFCTDDNTRTFDYKTDEIDGAVLDDIKKLLVDYPEDTQTRTILKTYLDELKSNKFRYSKKLEDKIMKLGILKDYQEIDANKCFI